MAVIKINIQLAIPKTIYDAIPLAKKTAFRDAVRAIKALAVKVNEGKPNEEMTVRADMHRCFHDENKGKECEPDQEI